MILKMICLAAALEFQFDGGTQHNSAEAKIEVLAGERIVVRVVDPRGNFPSRCCSRPEISRK